MTTEQPARIVVLGRIPDVGLSLLREAGQVWAWDRDEPIPGEVRDEPAGDRGRRGDAPHQRRRCRLPECAPRLKVVANVAVGFNNIDVAACAERGVLVTNTPGVLTDATADLAMALILMVTRRLARASA